MKKANNFRLAASIAFTHMRAKLKQTIIATAGVTFGITVFIFMVSFIKGTNNFMQDIVFEQSPHFRLYNEIEISDSSILDRQFQGGTAIVDHEKPKFEPHNLKDGNQALQELKRDPEVAAASGAVITQVFFRLGAVSVNGTVNGIDYEGENALFNLDEKLVDGSFSELSSQPNSMVIGVGLAKKLNVQTGDKLYIVTEQGDEFLVTVVGLIKTGLTDVDKQHSYVSLKSAQRFMRMPGSYITDIKVKLHDKEKAPELVAVYRKRYQYEGSDWKTDNAALLEGDVLRSMIVYGVAGTILLVAGFGIFNILTMMIYEKMKDIAILKAMGFSNTDVRRIFLTQAIVIGIVGALMGILFGFLLAYATSKAPFESDVMVTMDHLPVSFELVYYVTGFCFGIVTTALSGFIPSRKASKVDPIAILRG